MNKRFILFAIGVVLSIVGVVGFSQSTASADGYAPNCGASAVVTCGAYTQAELTARIKPDAQALYASQGIGVNIYLAKSGIVNPDGTVTVDGKTVATGAMTFGRVKRAASDQQVTAGGTNFWKHSITGAAIYRPVEAHVFLDSNGQFTGAVIKMCGNPVVAVPVPKPVPPKPQPKPQNIKCINLEYKIIDQTKRTVQATVTGKAEYTTIDGYAIHFGNGIPSVNTQTATHTYADYGEYTITGFVNGKVDGKPVTVTDAQLCVKKVKFEKPPVMIKVCELSTKKVVTIDEKNFDASKHSKNLDDCKTPEKIKVCELSTKKVITIDEKNFDATKHSKNLDDCRPQIKVCELSSKTVVVIYEDEFVAAKHTKDLTLCKPQIKVCDLATKTFIVIDEKSFDASKHSTNPADCKQPIEVCELSTKTMVKIDERIFDSNKYSKNPADCETKEPEVLPSTGPAAAFGVFTGVSALGAFGHRIWMSRRNRF